MKVLLLCGGRGVVDPDTRQRIPKCLLKIGNRPIIWHVMKLFSSYGHNDFVLSLGFGGEQIKNYFMNAFEFLHDIEVSLSTNDIKSLSKIPEENWTIKLVDTGLTASTGARVARCERYLKNEAFFISYSDILADVNIKGLVNFHINNNKMLTITGTRPSSRFGTFYKDGNILSSYDANARLDMGNSRINGGFMVADKTIFTKLSPISECNLETEVFSQLFGENEIALWDHQGFWQNVDTERELSYLQNLYENNKRPWLGIN